jgi:hypothetical protein
LSKRKTAEDKEEGKDVKEGNEEAVSGRGRATPTRGHAKAPQSSEAKEASS